MSAKSSKNFFSLLVPLAALIVTVTVITTQTNLMTSAKSKPKAYFTYHFEQGWNTFAPPLDTNLTYSDVCNQLPIFGIYAYNTNSNGANPVFYNCDPNNPSDLSVHLIANNGYTINLGSAMDWTISGTRSSVVNYDIQGPGLFAYGDPASRTKLRYADQFCKNSPHIVTGGDLRITEVYQQNSSEHWTTHYCDSPSDNNFELTYGEAYVLMVGQSDTNTPHNPTNLNSKLQNATQN